MSSYRLVRAISGLSDEAARYLNFNTGDQRLCWEVVSRAFRDAAGCIETSETDQEKGYWQRQAYWWLRDDSDHEFGCIWWLQGLTDEPEALKHKILEALKRPETKDKLKNNRGKCRVWGEQKHEHDL